MSEYDSRLSPSARRGDDVDKNELTVSAQQALGYTFRDPELLLTALTHASIADSRLDSNERLEFLGDAILGMVVCEQLFRRYEEWLEGDLTKVKSMLVSRRVCAMIADEVGLSQLLILGNGIENRSNLPTSLRAAVLESVIGAIFVDGGVEPAREFILRAIEPHLVRCANKQNHDNHKSALQQYVQRIYSSTPRYESLDEQGPDHSKCFEVCVVVDGERFPSAWGPSKKEAEQEAARRALECMIEREQQRHRVAQ
jgi:ribonuclease III